MMNENSHGTDVCAYFYQYTTIRIIVLSYSFKSFKISCHFEFFINYANNSYIDTNKDSIRLSQNCF